MSSNPIKKISRSAAGKLENPESRHPIGAQGRPGLEFALGIGIFRIVRESEGMRTALETAELDVDAGLLAGLIISLAVGEGNQRIGFRMHEKGGRRLRGDVLLGREEIDEFARRVASDEVVARSEMREARLHGD